MPNQPIETDEPTDEQAQAALEEFFPETKKVRERKEAARIGLDEALVAITATVSEHWGSGSGRRLGQIVWSLYHRSHLVGLGDVLTNFDADNCLEVAKLLDAKMAGVLDDAMLNRVLNESGESTRYEAAKRDTPEGEKVLYPPMEISTEKLRWSADSAAKRDARQEARSRAEIAQPASLEEAG